VKIPVEALQQAIAIVGRVGSGKTYAAKVLLEPLLVNDRAHTCIVDPTGAWWGLRATAKGTPSGIAIPIFGGDHGDVPLEPDLAGAIAEFVAGGGNAILDVSEFGSKARIRFMTTFLEDLYRLNKVPLHLIVDEADLFAPQRPQPDETVLLNRMEQIVRRGRVRGFVPWLITQRPAVLNKNVLSQVNTLVAMQLTGPQDRDAIGAWIEGQADRDEGKRVLAELPKLPKGEGYVWSPSHDFLDRVKFGRLSTFDSSAGPASSAPAPRVQDADLSGIAAKVQEIRDRQRENDPDALRARIAELEKAQPHEASDEALRAEYDRGYLNGRRDAATALAGHFSKLAPAIEQAGAALFDLRQDVGAWALSAADNERQTDAAAAPKVARHSAPPPTTRSNGKANGSLPKAERAILTAAAQRNPKQSSRAQLSLLSGYSITSSTFANALGALRTLGLIDGKGDENHITPAGLRAAGQVDPMPTGRQLVDWWISRLPKAEAALLRVAAEYHPRAISRERLSQESGYSLTSSSFANALGRLRSLSLIQGRGDVQATADLFGGRQ
jgi:uncharacterized protein